MKKGETIKIIKAREALAAAHRAHRAAVAEGRICACEGPHMPTCMAGGYAKVAAFYGVDAKA